MIEKRINEYNWDAMSDEEAEEETPSPNDSNRQPLAASGSSSARRDNDDVAAASISSQLPSTIDEDTSISCESRDSARTSAGETTLATTLSSQESVAPNCASLNQHDETPQPKTVATSNAEENADASCCPSNIVEEGDAYPVLTFCPPLTRTAERSSNPGSNHSAKSHPNKKPRPGTKANPSRNAPRFIRARRGRAFGKGMLRKLILKASRLAITAYETAKQKAVLLDERHHMSRTCSQTAQNVAITAKETAHRSALFMKDTSTSARTAFQRHHAGLEQAARLVENNVKRTQAQAVTQSTAVAGKAQEMAHTVADRAKITAHSVAEKTKEVAQQSASFMEEASSIAKHQVSSKAKHSAQVMEREFKKASDIAVAQSIRVKAKVIEFHQRHQIGTKARNFGRLFERQAKRATRNFKKWENEHMGSRP